MLDILKNAEKKLNAYYTKTKWGLDYFYIKATLLDPTKGDLIFNTSEWKNKPNKPT